MFGKGWGEGGPRGRFFEKGDLKYVILNVLADRPRHGYDVIRALEKRFRGFYSPSPGSVYPILQMLEDMGHLTSEQGEGRKVYTLTDGGRVYLAEWKTAAGDPFERMGESGARGHGWHHEAMHESMGHMKHELKELAQMLGRRAFSHSIDSDKLKRIVEVVARARHEIEGILRES